MAAWRTMFGRSKSGKKKQKKKILVSHRWPCCSRSPTTDRWGWRWHGRPLPTDRKTQFCYIRRTWATSETRALPASVSQHWRPSTALATEWCWFLAIWTVRVAMKYLTANPMRLTAMRDLRMIGRPGNECGYTKRTQRSITSTSAIAPLEVPL